MVTSIIRDRHLAKSMPIFGQGFGAKMGASAIAHPPSRWGVVSRRFEIRASSAHLTKVRECPAAVFPDGAPRFDRAAAPAPSLLEAFAGKPPKFPKVLRVLTPFFCAAIKKWCR